MERLFYFVIFGFKVETDVGSNENYVLIWIFEMHFVLLLFEGSDLVQFCSFFLEQGSTEDSNGCHDMAYSVLSFLGITLETDFEVDEGTAREWLFTMRCV